MNQFQSLCRYCGVPTEHLDGPHTCKQAQNAKRKIESEIAEMLRMNKDGPDNSTLTLTKLEEREQRRKTVANTVKIVGRKVKKGYR